MRKLSVRLLNEKDSSKYDLKCAWNEAMERAAKEVVKCDGLIEDDRDRQVVAEYVRKLKYNLT